MPPIYQFLTSALKLPNNGLGLYPSTGSNRKDEPRTSVSAVNDPAPKQQEIQPDFESRKAKRQSRLGTKVHLPTKAYIDEEDRIRIFKQSNMIYLKQYPKTTEDPAGPRFFALRNGTLSGHLSSINEPAAIEIPIANAIIKSDFTKKLLVINAIEGDRYHFLVLDQELLSDWHAVLEDVADRWGSVHLTEIQYEIADMRKQLGDLWEISAEDQNPRILKRIGELSLEIEMKDSLFGDMCAIQELYQSQRKKSNSVSNIDENINEKRNSTHENDRVDKDIQKTSDLILVEGNVELEVEVKEAAKKRTFEEQRLAEEARLKEEQEQRRSAEEARLNEERRLAEESKLQEQRRLAEEARLNEERRLAEEIRQREEALAKERALEEKRLGEEARLKEEQRLAEESKLQEQRRLAEEARLNEERRLAEEIRQREETLANERALEERRLAEEASLREVQRLAKEAKFQEQRRLAEEARLNEERRLAEEIRQREEALAKERAIEEARLREVQRLAEEAKLQEQRRLAEEARLNEERRLAEEAKLQEQRRLAEEARLNEERRLAEEIRQREEALANERALEEKRLTDEARLKEELRLAEEAKIKEQQRGLAREKALDDQYLNEQVRLKEANRIEDFLQRSLNTEKISSVVSVSSTEHLDGPQSPQASKAANHIPAPSSKKSPAPVLLKKKKQAVQEDLVNDASKVSADSIEIKKEILSNISNDSLEKARNESSTSLEQKAAGFADCTSNQNRTVTPVLPKSTCKVNSETVSLDSNSNDKPQKDSGNNLDQLEMSNATSNAQQAQLPNKPKSIAPVLPKSKVAPKLVKSSTKDLQPDLRDLEAEEKDEKKEITVESTEKAPALTNAKPAPVLNRTSKIENNARMEKENLKTYDEKQNSVVETRSEKGDEKVKKAPVLQKSKIAPKLNNQSTKSKLVEDNKEEIKVNPDVKITELVDSAKHALILETPKVASVPKDSNNVEELKHAKADSHGSVNSVTDQKESDQGGAIGLPRFPTKTAAPVLKPKPKK